MHRFVNHRIHNAIQRQAGLAKQRQEHLVVRATARSADPWKFQQSGQVGGRDCVLPLYRGDDAISDLSQVESHQPWRQLPRQRKPRVELTILYAVDDIE